LKQECDKITVLSVADLFAYTIKSVCQKMKFELIDLS